ncbi:MAG TPA: transcriptional repressor [Phycisphaerales bacterium]|jgi:Fur family ferric uptake transcriptional regulator|nr:transcriptional repressor [Phycisphaerales bacterium]
MAASSGQADALDGIRIVEPLCAVFRRKLKSEGLKYTPERAHILDAIIRRDEEGTKGGGVFQADELLASMRGAGFRVSKATIYRTIKLLAEAGIIQQVLFDAETAHYQLAYGKSASGLLVNVDTREITPIDLPELVQIRDRICRERGLAAEGHRVVVYARNRSRS